MMRNVRSASRRTVKRSKMSVVKSVRRHRKMLLLSLKAKARPRNKFKQRNSALKSVLLLNASLPRKLRRALKHLRKKARARRLSSL